MENENYESMAYLHHNNRLLDALCQFLQQSSLRAQLSEEETNDVLKVMRLIVQENNTEAKTLDSIIKRPTLH